MGGNFRRREREGREEEREGREGREEEEREERREGRRRGREGREGGEGGKRREEEREGGKGGGRRGAGRKGGEREWRRRGREGRRRGREGRRRGREGREEEREGGNGGGGEGGKRWRGGRDGKERDGEREGETYLPVRATLCLVTWSEDTNRCVPITVNITPTYRPPLRKTTVHKHCKVVPRERQPDLVPLADLQVLLQRERYVRELTGAPPIVKDELRVAEVESDRHLSLDVEERHSKPPAAHPELEEEGEVLWVSVGADVTAIHDEAVGGDGLGCVMLVVVIIVFDMVVEVWDKGDGCRQVFHRPCRH